MQPQIYQGEERPATLVSRNLTTPETRYSTTQRGLLVLVQFGQSISSGRMDSLSIFT